MLNINQIDVFITSCSNYLVPECCIFKLLIKQVRTEKVINSKLIKWSKNVLYHCLSMYNIKEWQKFKTEFHNVY